MSTGRAVDATGVAYSTLAGAVEHKQKLGILEEITGKQCDRLFAYAEYLAILNEGTEALGQYSRVGERLARAVEAVLRVHATGCDVPQCFLFPTPKITWIGRRRGPEVDLSLCVFDQIWDAARGRIGRVVTNQKPDNTLYIKGLAADLTCWVRASRLGRPWLVGAKKKQKCQ